MASIFDLSNELLDMILANLAKEGVFAIRSSCRGLRDDSWNHCARTYFAKLTVAMSEEGYRRCMKLWGQPRIKESIRHLWLILGARDGLTFTNKSLRNLFSELPNVTSLTLQHPNPEPAVGWKRTGKMAWKKEHRMASEQVVDVLLNLVVTPNAVASIDVRSSDFKDYADGLLRLDDLDVVARAAPLLRHNLASLVALSLSLNTRISEDPVPECYDALPTLVKGMPTLEELTLVGTKRPFKPYPPLILRALADATTGEQRLPKLKLLRLKWLPVEEDSLLRLISSHAKTLRKCQMTYMLLLHSMHPTGPQTHYVAYHAPWSTFLTRLNKEHVLWELSTYELMNERPQRAQRLNLRLWEKTPQREERLNRVRKDGETATVLQELSTVL